MDTITKPFSFVYEVTLSRFNFVTVTANCEFPLQALVSQLYDEVSKRLIS